MPVEEGQEEPNDVSALQAPRTVFSVGTDNKNASPRGAFQCTTMLKDLVVTAWNLPRECAQ